MHFDLDTHIHTEFSHDSLLKLKTLLKIAKKRNLNAIAITDHNTFKAFDRISKSYNDSDIMIVPGMEIKTQFGDLIALFINEEIRERDFNAVIDEVRSQDGLTVLAHPFRSHSFPNIKSLNRVDAIEVLNGRTSRKNNLKAFFLAKRLRKLVTAGSDAHFGFEVGSVRMRFASEPSDLENLKKLIKSRRFLIVGRESSPIVHFMSVTVELLKKIQYLNF